MGGRSESHLLRPLPAWTDWDERAATIHGISQSQLLAEGEPVAEVAQHLITTMAGHVVYASSPSWDGKWLSVLLRGAGLSRHALRLRDTDDAQLETARELLGGNGILLEHNVGRFVADAEAIYSYEGTREMNTLIVGRSLTGLSAFV